MHERFTWELSPGRSSMRCSQSEPLVGACLGSLPFDLKALSFSVVSVTGKVARLDRIESKLCAFRCVSKLGTASSLGELSLHDSFTLVAER